MELRGNQRREMAAVFEITVRASNEAPGTQLQTSLIGLDSLQKVQIKAS